MKGFFRLLFHRVGLVAVGIILQLAVLFAMLRYFWDVAPILDVGMTVLAWALVLYILSDRSNPAYKLAWIILIIGFPVFGVFLYVIFGGNRLSKRLKKKMSGMERTLQTHLQQDEAVMDALRWHEPDAAVQAQYLSNTAHCPVYQNTETVFFPSGEAAIQQMLHELERAERSIYLEYFIIAHGEVWSSVLEILKRKAAEGVDVRLIYDDCGCIRRLDYHYDRELEAFGIQARAFNRFVPLLDSRMNNRDHRKFLIIDGCVGFTGGVNLADEYANLGKRPFGHWKDCAVMLRGDAVWSMTVMFLSMWNYITENRKVDPMPEPVYRPDAVGYVQPYVDSPLDFEAVGRTVFSNMITRSRKRVWIMTPYLIIDDGMAETLTNAAKAGIDVRIITPGIPDKKHVYEMTRANYQALLEGKVRIFEYTPGFIHSKLFLADDDIAAVGTVNLDFRSLYLHFEDGVWIYRGNCMEQIRQDFDETFPMCREVTAEQAREVGLLRKLYRAVLRLLSPLM